jgi:hypothetical protein
VLDCCNLKVEAASSFENSLTVCPPTRRNIPEDMNPDFFLIVTVSWLNQ